MDSGQSDSTTRRAGHEQTGPDIGELSASYGVRSRLRFFIPFREEHCAKVMQIHVVPIHAFTRVQFPKLRMKSTFLSRVLQSFSFRYASTSGRMLCSRSSVVYFGFHPIARARFALQREFVPPYQPHSSAPKYLMSSSTEKVVGSGSCVIPSATRASPIALLSWYQVCSPFSPK